MNDNRQCILEFDSLQAYAHEVLKYFNVLPIGLDMPESWDV